MRIYFLMQEMIVYYYPVTGDNGNEVAKRFWFQEAALKAKRLGDMGCGDGRTAKEAEFAVVGCVVPPFYYRKRPWKPQVLSEAMETVLRGVEGMADTYLHPQIEAMLEEGYRRRFLPGRKTVQMLMKEMVGQYAGEAVRRSGEVTVLLGEPVDTDWQMEMTRELLLPYLPRINRMLIFYEEVAGTDIWMELANHLDEYYYEFGLVPQLEPYVEHCAAPGEETGTDAGDKRILRCGRTKCSGLILDYAPGLRCPRILPESRTVYIDTSSESGKEQFLRRKTPAIPYVSPLKYLDTMVKNSYDRLVN